MAEAEIHLPETIIQHIQSLLTGKEAARTTILSKAWYSAWLTRPNLEFDFTDGSFKTELAFLKLANKTIERYETLSLNIESFRLCARGARPEEGDPRKRDRFLIAREFIVKAMKLGATDLSVEVDPKAYCMDLPREVFGSQALNRLSVSGCEYTGIYGGKKVSCSKLKSFSLHRVLILAHLFCDIASSCPLIEELSFSDCDLVWPINPNPRPFFISTFHKLERLYLEKLNIRSYFFHYISSKFPCLKHLAIHHCGGFKSIQICSPSLECITIVGVNLRWANLDVPNIRHFVFSGSKFPCLCFQICPSSREWKSDISITYKPRYSWYFGLKNFLKRLSWSKVTLTLKFLMKSSDAHGLELRQSDFISQSLPRPWVENLMLSVDLPSSELLCGLFWSCRPNFVTAYTSILCTEFLWNMLVHERSESGCIRNRYRPYFDDIVEVTVEIFEESVAEWKPVVWETLLDDSALKIGFRLTWAPEPSTST